MEGAAAVNVTCPPEGPQPPWPGFAGPCSLSRRRWLLPPRGVLMTASLHHAARAASFASAPGPSLQSAERQLGPILYGCPHMQRARRLDGRGTAQSATHDRDYVQYKQTCPKPPMSPASPALNACMMPLRILMPRPAIPRMHTNPQQTVTPTPAAVQETVNQSQRHSAAMSPPASSPAAANPLGHAHSPFQSQHRRPSWPLDCPSERWPAGTPRCPLTCWRGSL